MAKASRLVARQTRALEELSAQTGKMGALLEELADKMVRLGKRLDDIEKELMELNIAEGEVDPPTPKKKR